MGAARDGSLLVSLKSLQDDHHTRARDDAQAALARAETEQRARLERERAARLETERARAHAVETAHAAEQARLAALAQEQAAHSAQADERLRLERARAALELRVAELERQLTLDELRGQASRFRDRALAWASGALCLLVIAAALGLYYGKLRRRPLEQAQANALDLRARRVTEAEGLLVQLRAKNDDLAHQNSVLRDKLREAMLAAPPPALPAHTGGHAVAHGTGGGAHVKPSGPCPDSWDPLLGCL